MFDATQKRKEMEREIVMRLRLYPRWVSEGRMTTQEADERIAIAQAIVEDYRALELQDQLPLGR